MRAFSLKAAELLGTAAAGLVRGWPGIAGAACACVGFGLIYRPLAFLTAAVFLLVLDYRRP